MREQLISPDAQVWGRQPITQSGSLRLAAFMFQLGELSSDAWGKRRPQSLRCFKMMLHWKKLHARSQDAKKLHPKLFNGPIRLHAKLKPDS